MKRPLRLLLNRERFFAVTFTRSMGSLFFGVAIGDLAFASDAATAVPYVALAAALYSSASRWKDLHERAQLAQEAACLAYMAMHASGRSLMALLREGRYEAALSIADQQAHIADVFLAGVGGTNGDG